MLDGKIAMIGSGYMAEAIIKGIVNKNVVPAEKITVINPVDEKRVLELAKTYGIVPGVVEKNLSTSDVVILAFKPQDLTRAMDMYRDYLREDQLLISILAGVSTQLLQKLAVTKLPIVRTMPNLALGVGEGAIAYCLGTHAGENHAEIVETMFSAVGSVVRVNESDMDAVTALSGSGPAYIYYLLEGMIEGACKEGLNKERAEKLAVQTLLGAAKLLQDSGESPEELRKKISSPRGTTEMAINKLQSLDFIDIVCQAVASAAARSSKLGENLEKLT